MTTNIAMEPIGIETVGMSKVFGSFIALEDVSIKIRPGSFHALLGENGAGKSTLVKCIMGFYHPTSGQLIANDREVRVRHPQDAHALGLGMVYQHFTLVPSLTGEENLVINRDDAPSLINWKYERDKLAAFMTHMPFQVDLSVPVNRLSAGEKQKLELLKQLYLGRRFLILDEPTSVLTPIEASELLETVKGMTQDSGLTVLMITHKFREVEEFADEVSVLRRGLHIGTHHVTDVNRTDMTQMMIGERTVTDITSRIGKAGDCIFKMKNAKSPDRSGFKSIDIDELEVHASEIVGIAGISGNGQFELVEMIAGQRPLTAGQMHIGHALYDGSRSQQRAFHVRIVPEEPLRNASAPRMSVTENIAFRDFDFHDTGRRRYLLDQPAMRATAARLVEQFRVKTSGLDAPIASLSGGNVQRAILARELDGTVKFLVVSNPCFGLDILAVAEIRSRIVAARNEGAAVLLLSEDLDEILELSDRIYVMSEGQLVYHTSGADADVTALGKHMAGHQ